MQLSDPVMAALIGATATFVTAFLQLVINARRQAAERAAGKPASRKPGTWLAILALMLASAVGGYAFAQYQVYSDREDGKMLRQEMQSKLRDISEVAVRLEKAGMQRNDQSEMEARIAVERRRGLEGVAAVVGLPACAAGQGDAQSGCSEGNAVQASVCVTIPLSATVSEVQVFSRTEDSQQPWADARVQPGQEAGGIKFVDAYYERPQQDAKEICQRVAYWGGQKGRLARVLVKYTL